MQMEMLVHIVIPALGDIVRLVLTLLAIAVPVFCALKGYGVVKTNLVSLPIVFVILVLGAYLSHAYPLLLLKIMGFDLQGMNEAERLLMVAPALKDTATEIYSTIFGIGWPLKAMLAMIFVSPYPTAVWVGWTLVKSGLKKA